MADSLLGHIAVSLSAHPENIGTEALGYILRKSPGAQEGLRSLFALAGIPLATGLAFRNQASGQTGERPDLVAIDEDGQEPLVIEAKFWAGLTDNQPVGYLTRLPQYSAGALLFVAPAQRVEYLWSELIRRCQTNDVLLSDTQRPASAFVTARIGSQHYLAIASWRQLLESMAARLDSVADRLVLTDIEQLAGLCERMDSQAFIPVTGDELTLGAYRRVIDFAAMLDDISNVLVESGVASKEGLRSVGGLGYYGRYLRLQGVGVLLSCDIQKWMALQPTPFWLTVFGPEFKATPSVKNALAPLEAEVPPRLFIAADAYPTAGYPTIPLMVPVGVERDGVVAEVARQLREIAVRLEPIGASYLTTRGTPPELPSELVGSETGEHGDS